ncbi:YCF48-related protein [Fulvivirgaceae bacterium BMA12]|uniref:YCF48-related protein n=1 Tax=Agaribacillus aureus TaxID=3051825 RepID=A0ABT8L5Z1_9BACT|nr:YCF48-related protein [Fulvivirgaceae bacterium BMA12]
MRRQLLVAMLLCACSGKVAAQWEQLSPQSPFIYGAPKLIAIPGADAFYAFGAQMISSENNGETWNIIAQNGLRSIDRIPTDRFYDIHFPAASAGFMINRHEIFATTDGNETWTRQLALESKNEFSNNPTFNAIHFASTQVGYAVGDFEKIFKTNDGGTTWEEISWSAVSSPYVSLTDVAFLNENVGYITGYRTPDIANNFAFSPFIMRTEDGGANWNRQPIPITLLSDHRKISLHLTRGSVFTGFSRSQFAPDFIYRWEAMTDQWAEIPLPAGFKVKKMFWTSPETGFIIGEDDQRRDVLYRSVDSGANWTRVLFDQQFVFRDIAFNSPDHGVITGEWGLLATADGGQTWETKFEPQHQFRSSVMAKDSIISLTQEGLLINHLDPRNNPWKVLNGDPVLDNFQKVVRLDNGSLALPGFFNGIVFLSKDKGKTLDPVSSTPLLGAKIQNIGDLLMLAGKTFGSPGVVFLSSTNEGTTWDQVTVDPAAGFATSFSVTSDTTLFVSTVEKLFQSSDYGKTWVEIARFPNERITNSYFIDKETGFLFLDNHTMIKTDDQGTQWRDVQISPEKEILVSDLYFINDTLGLMAGSSQLPETSVAETSIWKTTDGGDTWEEETLDQPYLSQITDLLRKDSTIYATGYFGLMLKARLKDIFLPASPVTGIDPPKNINVKIYPNPLTTQLAISRQTTTPATVQMIDLSGRVLKTLHVKDKKEIVLDIQLLPPGIYAIRLTTPQTSFTAKFVKE